MEGYVENLTLSNGIFAAIEVFGSVLATFFLLRLLSLFGRRTWQILASLVVIISAAASYYMTFMNVVIGYGIVASVMTTDIDLSKEVVGKGFIVWTVLACLIPLFFIWSNTCRYTLLRQLRTRGQRIRNIVVVLLAGLLVWLIRSFGGYPDGVAFAVLLANITVPLIDYYTRPRVYGHR